MINIVIFLIIIINFTFSSCKCELLRMDKGIVHVEINYHMHIQMCQLVRFTRKPYRFLQFAWAYGRMMQFLRIFMIFADSNL